MRSSCAASRFRASPTSMRSSCAASRLRAGPAGTRSSCAASRLRASPASMRSSCAASRPRASPAGMRSARTAGRLSPAARWLGGPAARRMTRRRRGFTSAPTSATGGLLLRRKIDRNHEQQQKNEPPSHRVLAALVQIHCRLLADQKSLCRNLTSSTEHSAIIHNSLIFSPAVHPCRCGAGTITGKRARFLVNVARKVSRIIRLPLSAINSGCFSLGFLRTSCGLRDESRRFHKPSDIDLRSCSSEIPSCGDVNIRRNIFLSLSGCQFQRRAGLRSWQTADSSPIGSVPWNAEARFGVPARDPGVGSALGWSRPYFAAAGTYTWSCAVSSAPFCSAVSRKRSTFAFLPSAAWNVSRYCWPRSWLSSAR